MGKSTKLVPALILGIAALFAAANSARAMPITYTEEATASGSLNGVVFTDDTVVLTMSNVDTNNVTGGPLFVISGTATLSVNGGSPVTFTDPIQVFSNEFVSVAGFWDAGFTTPIDILDTSNAAFAAYDLKSFIGPISGAPIISAISFPTTGGAFILTNVGPVGGPTSTFTASPAIPEPSTFALFGAALAGLGVIRRRRNVLTNGRR